MAISAEIIADSLNPKGDRITTFVLEYPRFIHAEVLTHRVFSRNAASSRAIPIKKMIESVIKNPAMPVFWGKNKKGMQAKEEVSPFKKQLSKFLWLRARDAAIIFVRLLNFIGVHKQISNRIIEPWFNIKVLLTGTDFENFFALRAHDDAQPEFQELAYKMLHEYNKSVPKQLNAGEWHIPFGDKIETERLMSELELSEGDDLLTYKLQIATARCARVSYLNFEGKDNYKSDVSMCEKLFGSIPKHLSPTEHSAQAQNDSNYYGNFRGFKPYRKFIPNENLIDPRVTKK